MALRLLYFCLGHWAETPSDTVSSWGECWRGGHRGEAPSGNYLKSFPFLCLSPTPNSETSLGPKRICLVRIWAFCPLCPAFYLILYQKEHLLVKSCDFWQMHTVLGPPPQQHREYFHLPIKFPCAVLQSNCTPTPQGTADIIFVVLLSLPSLLSLFSPPFPSILLIIFFFYLYEIWPLQIAHILGSLSFQLVFAIVLTCQNKKVATLGL